MADWYTVWRTRLKRGDGPDVPAANAALTDVHLTDVHSSDARASCSAAEWISRARIGRPADSSTKGMVPSTGLAFGGA